MKDKAINYFLCGRPFFSENKSVQKFRKVYKIFKTIQEVIQMRIWSLYKGCQEYRIISIVILSAGPEVTKRIHNSGEEKDRSFFHNVDV